MKKFKLYKIASIALALVCVSGLAASIVRATLAPGAVDLGAADNFAVFADDAITDANPPTGIILGDVGLTPTTGAAITGLTCTQVTGTIYDIDGAYGGLCETADAALLAAADNALSTAYNFAKAQAPLPDIVTELGGQVLGPGVYHAGSGTFSISSGTTLTLDGGGDPDSVFIFQTDSTLNTTGASNSVVLTGGAQACNVFWKVGTSVTLDTNTTFAGTIMAAVSITDAGCSTVAGRLLADADETDIPETGSVTLNNTDVTVPSCAPSLTLQKTVTNDNGGTALNTAWTLTAVGAGGSPTNLSGTTPVNSNVTFADATFEADTYTLAESGGPAGYTEDTYSCVINGGGAVVSNSITLAPGDDAVCTVHNDDQTPSLTLEKVVVNDDAGVSLSSDWTLTATGPSGFTGVGPTVTGGASFDSGTYDLSETGPTGYTASDWVCIGGTQVDGDTVSLTIGQSATCTITNNDVTVASSGSGGSSGGGGGIAISRPATLRVVKQVINDSGGTLNAALFNLHVKLEEVDISGSPALGTASPGRSYTLSSGTYVISEDPTNEYVQSFIGDCDSSGRVTLSSGDDKICIVINNDIAVVVAPAVTFTPSAPGLPATGSPPQEKRAMLPIAIFASIFVASTFLYFAHKKQPL